MSLAGLLALAPWAARREEEPTEGLVPFGSSPAHSFSLTAGGACAVVPLVSRSSLTRPASAEDPQAGHTVVHAYGAPTVALQSQLSSIQASGLWGACPSGALILRCRLARKCRRRSASSSLRSFSTW